MKSCGCRPMCLLRHFSEAIGTSKLKRKTNYYVPLLSEERKQSIKRIVSLQMSGQYLSCTTILRDGNILDDWKMICMPGDMSKFNLNDVYNSVVTVMKELPESDVYVIENHVKMPTNVNNAIANSFSVKLQTITMLIALINSRQTENLPDHTPHMNKVILMKARLHARLFKIFIGSEIISSQGITESMLKGTFPDYVTPIVPEINAILSYRSIKDPVIRELLSNGLMLAMTFVDLILNSNPRSIQAIMESSRRKSKTKKK